MLASADRSRGVEEPPSIAIVTAVAEHEGVDPTALRPPEYDSLYRVCDPDALDALFASDSTTKGSVCFRFCGYEVEVTSEGTVSVVDPNVQ
ncbi:HalOD1 output domain-containing protein [Halovivax cerinus]|uniref:HalOD1 output domain-containing protein n=1 Tax=Halovivax cerinus TaxID=1487865 RepID=A0ABD5NMN4_9EURY|nr:HalOD1 output domain-containing protein [Halovivax cerinus]